MRVVVDLSSDGEDRISGSVAADEAARETFSGWLELLRILERCAQDSRSSASEPGDGPEEGEQRCDGA